MRLRLLTDRDVSLSDLLFVRPISLATYIRRGGYLGLAQAVKTGPESVLESVRQSGLRGRGGAGFPTWKKWERVIQQKNCTKYLCVNAAEDEPGTFKDRYLLRANPHQIIEGAIVSAFAIGAKQIYLYINGRYDEEIQFMEQALLESKQHRYWGEGSASEVDIKVTRSPGTYVAGEETALIEVIEGRVAKPRQKPPYYPANSGLFGMPTAVNNAETIANIPHIVRNGADQFRSIGSPRSPGTMVFTLTGEVRRPGLYELPLGTTVRELIDQYGGGAIGRMKAVFPGGPSNAILSGDKIDVALDFDEMKEVSSGLGTGAVIVFSEKNCMVRVAILYSRFFSRESCGQCPPCILGTKHLSEILEQIESGQGTDKEIRMVEQVCGMIKGRGYCYLLTGAAIATESIFQNFRPEFEAHIHGAGCPIV